MSVLAVEIQIAHVTVNSPFIPHTLFTFFADGLVGFGLGNVIVTEGTDDFAVVRISFLSPSEISNDTFTTLSIFTSDGTAMGTVVE